MSESFRIDFITVIILLFGTLYAVWYTNVSDKDELKRDISNRCPQPNLKIETSDKSNPNQQTNQDILDYIDTSNTNKLNMEYEFKVFTLNCWLISILFIYLLVFIFYFFRGISLISKDRLPRMKAIADALLKADYDIVCLQEVWTKTDFFLIRDEVADVLPYAHYFYRFVDIY